MLFFPTVLNFFTLFFFRNAKIHLRKLLTTSPVILVKNQRIYYIFNFFQHVRNMHFRRALLQKRIFSDFLNRQFLLDFSSLIEWHMSDPMFSPRVQVTFRHRRDRFVIMNAWRHSMQKFAFFPHRAFNL